MVEIVVGANNIEKVGFGRETPKYNTFAGVGVGDDESRVLKSKKTPMSGVKVARSGFRKGADWQYIKALRVLSGRRFLNPSLVFHG